MPRENLDRSTPEGGRSICVPVLGSVPVPEPLRVWAGSLASLAVAAAFWLAVVVPLALLVLLAGGLDAPTDVTTFLVLVAVDGAALVAGRGYAAPEAGGE